MSESTATERPSWGRWVPWLVLMVALVVAFGVAVWRMRWMSDDGFINIRVIQNLLAGHGPVFNIGERIEAYTSPLWVGLVTAVGLIGVRPEHAAAGLGIIGSVAGLALAQAGALRLRIDRGEWLEGISKLAPIPAGVAIYAAIPVAWDYGTSGLENGLGLVWLGGTYFALVDATLPGWESDEASKDPPDRWRYAVAALIGLGPLVRPELALFSIAFFVPFLYRHGRDEDGALSIVEMGKLAAAAGTLPVAYQIFRMGYFAGLVPNTAVAKSAFESRWEQGWYYVENFFGLYVLAVPLAIMFAFFVEHSAKELVDRRWTRLLLVVGPVLAGLGQCFYVVKVGGGFMHGRLFLPGLFGMMLPVAVVPLRGGGSWLTARRAAAMLMVFGWAAYTILYIRVPRENQHGIGDERGWYVRHTKGSNPVTVDDYASMHFTKDAMGPRKFLEGRCSEAAADGDVETGTDCEPFVYVDRRAAGILRPNRTTYPLRERVAEEGVKMAALRTGIGIRSLVMGPEIHVVDRAGLASPIAARIEIKHRGRPGHERQLPNWWYVGRFAEPSEGEAYRVTEARRALDCGRLGRLDRAVYEPLTISRFFANILESFRLRGIVIPRDPSEAVRKFCGTPKPYEESRGGKGGNKRRWMCPEGYLLEGVEVIPKKPGKPLARIRPRCRRVAIENGEIEYGNESVRGPNFGGSGRRGVKHAKCSGGKMMTGLTVSADKMVRGIGVRCGSVRLDSRGEAAISKSSEGACVGRVDDLTTLTCREGELPGGVVIRSGSLIDAAGVICRWVGE